MKNETPEIKLYCKYCGWIIEIYEYKDGDGVLAWRSDCTRSDCLWSCENEEKESLISFLLQEGCEAG